MRAVFCLAALLTGAVSCGLRGNKVDPSETLAGGPSCAENLKLPAEKRNLECSEFFGGELSDEALAERLTARHFITMLAYVSHLAPSSDGSIRYFFITLNALGRYDIAFFSTTPFDIRLPNKDIELIFDQELSGHYEISGGTVMLSAPEQSTCSLGSFSATGGAGGLATSGAWETLDYVYSQDSGKTYLMPRGPLSSILGSLVPVDEIHTPFEYLSRTGWTLPAVRPYYLGGDPVAFSYGCFGYAMRDFAEEQVK